MSWTREEYDAMQERAHAIGYHLITPYRKGLKNIRVGVIVKADDTVTTAASTDLSQQGSGKNATEATPTPSKETES